MRWRLLGWYAGLLCLVVAGFGTVLYYQVRQGRLDEIDAELQAGARILEGALRGFPPSLLDGSPQQHPPFPEGPFPEGPPPWHGGGRRPPPHHPPPHHLPPPPQAERRLETTLTLPTHFAERFGDDRGSAPFFIIWLNNGDILKASALPEGMTQPELTSLPEPVGQQHRVRQNGPVRELIVKGPLGTRILVGRSIQHELLQLGWLGWQLFLTALGVLAVGLAGGWLLSSRAFRPIAAMSSTAAAISASSLSHRIDVKEVDSELGQLGAILNNTFARLEAAFERQARFTADASHELRTPLAVIHSHAELALSRPRTPQEYQDTLSACIRASRRMKVIVEGLLTLARADAGKLELKCQSLDLGLLVRETVTLLEPLAAQKSLSLTVQAPPLEIRSDMTRLTQVITNLVTNAISYNRSGGKVWVRLKTEAGEAVLSVADTGYGIAEEDRPHVFERFYRADKARSREQGGSGLGLAISRSIIEALGGSITFTSRLNEGTTFVVRLPLDGSQAKAAMTES